MTPPRSTPDPFDSVRDAFADLGTSEKAAFVLEATFETLGQALSETGRRAARFVDDLDVDSWFNTPSAGRREEATPSEPPPMASTPAAIKKTSTRPEKKKPSSDSPSKTAGKPPSDDS